MCMAIPQISNAVFYHPLDNLTETLQSQAWNGFGESFDTGKVSNALAGGVAQADTPAAYPTGVGATRLAFAMWTRSLGPSVTPFSGMPPQVFRETDRTFLMAIGMPPSLLGGFT